MNSFAKLTWTELKLTMREPASVFFTLAFPILLLVVFGGIYGNEPNQFLNGFGSVDISVPGYIGMIIGTLGMMGLPISLASYRENGILRRYRATPIRPATLLWSTVAVNVLMQTLGIVLLLGVAFPLYGLRIPNATWALVPAVLLGGFSFFAVGFVLASVLPSARTAQAVGMALFYPMLFLSGAAMPREIMPDGIRMISELLPLTHVVKLIEDLWFKGTWNITSLLVVVGLMIACLAVTRFTFRWE